MDGCNINVLSVTELEKLMTNNFLEAEEDSETIHTPISLGCPLCLRDSSGKYPSFVQKKVYDKLWWYCPNGHGSFGEIKSNEE